MVNKEEFIAVARQIRKYTNSEICKVIEEDLLQAHKVYHDDKTALFGYRCVQYDKVFSYEEVLRRLNANDVIDITDEEYEQAI